MWSVYVGGSNSVDLRTYHVRRLGCIHKTKATLRSPPYSPGHLLGWSLDFHDLLIKQLGKEGIEPRFELTEAHAASNAQADT